MRDEPGDEHLVMARMGILASQPGFREGPVHVVHPVVNLGTAVLAAQGITASLFAREKTGFGRKVDTSVMAGSLMFSPKIIGERLGAAARSSLLLRAAAHFTACSNAPMATGFKLDVFTAALWILPRP